MPTKSIFIDYTYDNSWETAFSLKIEANWKVFLAIGRNKRQYFHSVIKDDDKLELIQLIKAVISQGLSDKYLGIGVDHARYKLIISDNHQTKSIYAHSLFEPESLKNLSIKLNYLKNDYEFRKDSSEINFESSIKFFPLEPAGAGSSKTKK
jgi:hypothetical protein